MDPNCLFCKIVAGEIPADKVFEDEDFIGIVDIKPVNLGHILLVPKVHSRNLLDMSEELLQKAGPHLQTLATAVKTATQADGINIHMNNEPAGGQLIFHTHFHIIPRFEGDGFEHWHGKTVPTPEELTSIGENIKHRMSNI
ncbi:MAG: HIT family protein [bacterium]|nr:HIT family protein [bacterium]